MRIGPTPPALEAVRPRRGPHSDPSRAADRDIPAGLRCALDRTTVRDTALTINRLGERDIDAMIDGVVGNKLLPANIRHDIIERTDGIPLFVEEMTKAVLEAESEGAVQRTVSLRSVTRSGGSSKSAGIVDGAARPARIGQGGCADWSGDWARVPPRSPICRSEQAGGRVGISPGPSGCCWLAVPARRASPCQLLVQTRTCARHCLRHVVARTATRTPRSHCRNAGKTVRGDCRKPTRTTGASLH